MIRRLCVLSSVLAVAACAGSSGTSDQDAGTHPVVPDAGSAECSAEKACPAGQLCDGGACVPGCDESAPCGDELTCCSGTCIDTQTDLAHCGSCNAEACTTSCSAGVCRVPVSASLDLFEISGSINVGITVDVQVLAPYVSVTQGTPPAHDYDDRSNGLGCYADHYTLAAKPPPADANAGPIRITGYSGGTLLTSSHAASNEINCAIVGQNYQCGYGALQNGQPSAAAAGVPYSSGTNPLGNGPIIFADSTDTVLGTFSVTGSPVGTVSVTQNLGSLHFSATQDVTLSYSCSSGSCLQLLVLVTLAATQNTGSNLAGSSSTFGAATCAARGGSSMTIPKAAIAAMLGNDSSLKSVLTSVVLAEPAAMPAQDSNGNPINVLVGRGVFGVSSLPPS